MPDSHDEDRGRSADSLLEGLVGRLVDLDLGLLFGDPGRDDDRRERARHAAPTARPAPTRRRDPDPPARRGGPPPSTGTATTSPPTPAPDGSTR